MGTEIWKDIKGYEGLYQVSNFGRVKSFNYLHHKGLTRILKTSYSKSEDRYPNVILTKDGKQKTLLVHRLVAETFLPNPNNLPCVNHKDETRTNNFAGTPENDYKDGNLEWCTHEYNINYGSCKKRIGEKNKERNTNGKLSKPILQYTKDGVLVREWLSMMEIQRQLGYRTSSICACCQGLYKQSHGFIWRYK